MSAGMREDVERVAAYFEGVTEDDAYEAPWTWVESCKCAASVMRALLDRAEKAEAERDKLRADGGAEAEPVAWGETYDGGNFFHTVSLSRTRHYTVPLYAHPLVRPSAPETMAWTRAQERAAQVPATPGFLEALSDEELLVDEEGDIRVGEIRVVGDVE